MPPRFLEAREAVERVYGNRLPSGRGPVEARALAPKEVKSLWTGLEMVLGPREEWRVPMLRELWSVLFAGAGRRRRSVDHERVFLQLLGFTLRPGFGYPLDEWRCDQTFRLFAEGVQAAKEKPVWNEFWVLWRRLAGGLGEARHTEIWQMIKPHLAHRVPPSVPKHIAKPKGVQPEGLEEMVRLAAALEHLASGEKALLGDWIAARLKAGGSAAGPWAWALGRLGARAPLYGSAHNVVDPETAGRWTELLLQPDLAKLEGALFPLALLAQLTGDRARDLAEPLRAQVRTSLVAAGAPASWIRMVNEAIALEATDKARALGDTLPVGLQFL